MRIILSIIIIITACKGYSQTFDTIWTDTTVILQEINSEGLLDGSYTEYYYDIDHDIMVSGSYLDGKKHGEWIVYDVYYYSGRVLEKGKYKNGNKTGVWNYYYEVDNSNVDTTIDFYKAGCEWIELSVTYNNGKREGQCTYSVGIHNWKDEFIEMRPLFSGEYKNDEKNGEWKLFDVLDSSKKGKKEVSTLIYSNGKLAEPVEIYLGINNSIQVLPYIDIIDNVEVKEIRLDASYSMGKYLAGKKSGNWNFYTKFGELVEAVEYRDGNSLLKGTVIDEVDEIEISFLHPDFIDPTDIVFSENKEYVVSVKENFESIVYALFTTKPAKLINSGKIDIAFKIDTYKHYLGELTNDGRYLEYVESKDANTVAYFNLLDNSITYGSPVENLFTKENDGLYYSHGMRTDYPYEITYTNDTTFILNTETKERLTLNNNKYDLDDLGYITIRISPESKFIGIQEKKIITIWDLSKQEVIWTSPAQKGWNMSSDYFALLSNNIIVSPKVQENQKDLHLHWFDFINNKVIYSSEIQPFSSISYLSQIDNVICLGLGETDKRKTQAIAKVDLSTGGYQIPILEKYNYKDYKQYSQEVEDSIQLANPIRYKLVNDNYQYAWSWSELYSRFFNDDKTKKNPNNICQLDLSFFDDHNFSHYYLGDVYDGSKKYEINFAFENKATYRDKSEDFNLFFLPASIKLKKELLFWNGNKTIARERNVTMLWSVNNFPFFYTPDHYYFSSQDLTDIIYFKVNGKQFSFDQFDLKFNRPDIILDRLGYADSSTIKLYRNAYLKRLKRMGFTEDMLKSDFHLPEIEIPELSSIPSITDKKEINLSVNLSDSKYKLDRINVWINNVAIYGVDGISLRKEDTQQKEKDIKIPLHHGENKVQLSVLNQAGAESYKESFEIECTVGKTKPDLYIAAISVSDYQQSNMNLRYAVKDGRDITNLYSQNNNETYENIYVDTLFDSNATLENVSLLKEKLLGTHVDDQVILYVSGHGLLDDNLDFYFASHDMDFSDPALRGISYEILEGLLDSIPARKKLFMMDACHSGEVDKDELIVSNETSRGEGTKSGVSSYSYRGANASTSNTSTYKLGLQNSFELMQELFTDLNRGSGAMVISAAAGDSYALESNEWNNGVFTYAIINGLKNNAADADGNGEVSVSELRSYVIEQVQELTDGKQKPTSRQENIEFDFRVW